MTSCINNLTKEGQVQFPKGKKPEKLVGQIFSMTTQPGDIVLDSFLGSGTSAAVAHEMGRTYIGIELGDQAYTHCCPRLQHVIDGEDQGGITISEKWEGGGGFKFYELAPSLLQKDSHGQFVINKEYNANMLAAAMAKHEGFDYEPSSEFYWKQGRSSENDYIYTTTQFLTKQSLEKIHDEMNEEESLLICCKAFQPECESAFKNIAIKKIPKMLLGRCEYDKNNYNLNIISLPEIDDCEENED